MVQDLLHPRFAADLQGYRAIRQLSIERIGVEAESDPHNRARRADLVWELEYGDARRLLLLEHQSQVDPSMSVRMAEYMLNVWHNTGRRRDVPIYPLVFSTARRPFGTWPQYWPHPAGNQFVGFVDGPLLDIHQYPFPSRDPAVFDLPRDNLVTSVVALARLQWELRERPREPVARSTAYGLLMHIMEDWLKPRLEPAGSELGDAFAVWIATGMQAFLASWPASREALDKISTLTFAQLERAMITVQELVQEVRQEGRQEGRLEGRLETLTDYVQLYWDDATAAAFQMRLADAPPAQLPTLAELQSRLQRRESPLPPDNDASRARAD